MIDKSPILITGVPRSGSTMIAAALNACGAFGGSMSKRGMYNNDLIRELAVKPYLNSMGIDDEAQIYFPKNISIPTNWKEKIDNILIGDGYKGGEWMYKDSRMCQMWQVWDYAYPDAKWVIVRRKPGDIIRSCMKTTYMTSYKAEEGWLNMIHEYEKRFVEMITKGANCKQIWPERMVKGDFQQLYDLCEWVGLEWNEKALGFIETLLWGTETKERRIYNGTSNSK